MNWMFVQADAEHLPLDDQSVDLVFTSPPYADARTYGIDAQRSCQDWIDWMVRVVAECCRVSRGLVLVNCAGVTRDRVYWPACEGLAYEWWKRGGNLWRPAFWHRVGIPGSGGKQWLRADIEYVIPFKRDREWLPFSDNTANGHPPKWGPGGEMSHRLSDGARVNQWGMRIRVDGTLTANETAVDGRRISRSTKPSHKVCGASRRNNGEMKSAGYDMPTLANPGNLIKIIVGGGLMGHPCAHENEAPFPVALAEWFIKGWCPKGGIVLDPFSGSGTTVDAATRLGRIGIGGDIRFNQCELGTRRMTKPAPKRPVKKAPVPTEGERQLSIFGAT